MASPAAVAFRSLPPNSIADEMVGAIASDFGGEVRGDALLLVNGFGATPLMELYLIYNAVRSLLEKQGASVSPFARGKLRHLARHGRMLDYGLHAGRGAPAAMGRACGDAGPRLGPLSNRVAIFRRRFRDCPRPKRERSALGHKRQRSTVSSRLRYRRGQVSRRSTRYRCSQTSTFSLSWFETSSNSTTIP